MQVCPKSISGTRAIKYIQRMALKNLKDIKPLPPHPAELAPPKPKTPKRKSSTPVSATAISLNAAPSSKARQGLLALGASF